MVFVDVNTFYGPKAGGIRTYHQAKLDWFAKQNEHVYCLIHPGPVYKVEQPAPSVYLIQVESFALTADPQGYRLMWNYFRVAKWIRKLRPEVIEAGDAWLSSWFLLLLRAIGFWDGLLVSFYHSDPIPSYLIPWSRRGRWRRVRRGIARVGAALFYSIQRRFDWTVTASRIMEDSLRRQNILNVKRLPFGVNPAFFLAPVGLRRDATQPTHLLYAGRLDRDKGIELLLQALPELLADPSVQITVAGRGAFSDRFASICHERFKFAGFVTDLKSLVELYASHAIFLAPGPHETFGLAVLEAMASGLIVVGPDAGGTGELLSEMNSPFRFAAGDLKDFMDKIRAARAADIEQESLRHRELALRYGTWDDAIARMVSTWRELVR